MDFKKAKRNHKFERWIILVLLTSLLLGSNFIVSKIDYQIDLTPDDKFTISRESLALLNKIKDPVDIIITIPENNRLPKVVQRLMHDLSLILESFEQESKKIPIKIYKVDVHSPLDRTSVLNKHKISDSNLIVIASPNGRKKTIFRYQKESGTNPYDMSQIFTSEDSLARQAIWESGFYEDWKEMGNGVMEPSFFRGEQVLMKSILEVAGEKDVRHVAYFTRGHGEGSPSDVNEKKGFSELRRIIENANLEVSTIDLSVIEQIPSNAKMIIAAGPKGAFLEKEISNLRNFLNQSSGKALIALDPVDEISLIDRPAMGLRPLLSEWGLRCHDMLLYDPQKVNFDLFSGAYSLRTYPQARPHSIIRPLMEKGFTISAARCRPVEAHQKVSSRFKSNELLYSSRDSWAVSGWTQRKTPPKKNSLLDIDGPVPIIAVSESRNSNARSGKLAVIGCSYILANANLTRNSGNKFLSQNLIRWLNGNDELLDIPPKKLNNYSLSMNNVEFKKLLYLLIIVPTAIAMLGIFVSWLRKEL